MDYRAHYAKLIERSQSRLIVGYFERHHIIPRCIGGSDDPENIAHLTPEEHYVAHQLLVKIHDGNSKMIFAALAMTRGRPGNKRYGWLRRKFAVSMSAVWLGKTRAPFTDEHRQRIAASQIGRVRGPHSDDHKARLSSAHQGKTLSAEHRAKLSVAHAGVKRNPYQKKTCPCCGYVGAGGSMSRWHFDNCKRQAA